jgi:hypothetical protein
MAGKRMLGYGARAAAGLLGISGGPVTAIGLGLGVPIALSVYDSYNSSPDSDDGFVPDDADPEDYRDGGESYREARRRRARQMQLLLEDIDNTSYGDEYYDE